MTRAAQEALEECLAPSRLRSSGQESRCCRVGWGLLTDRHTNAIKRQGDTNARSSLPTLLIYGGTGSLHRGAAVSSTATREGAEGGSGAQSKPLRPAGLPRYLRF